MKLTTGGELFNQSSTQCTLDDSPCLLEVVHPSPRNPYLFDKHVRQSKVVLQLVGKTKLNFEGFDYQSEHCSGSTSSQFIDVIFIYHVNKVMKYISISYHFQ